MVIVEHPADPVSVTRTFNKVELRIGGESRGEGRLAYLTPTEAKVLAYALLSDAERVTESPMPRGETSAVTT